MTLRKLNSLIVLVSFLGSLIAPTAPVHAQTLLDLPEPGTMVSVSPAYKPAIIKGVIVHKDNPFLFDFIVDTGDDHINGVNLKKQSNELIKYFLAGLTIPEKDLWVNLSPYEKNRIIPENLSQTDMGRDLLAQDYILKQITASLIYPDKGLGQEFWQRVYAKAQQMYGTTEIPVNTFNKVWITADRAKVYEHDNAAFVVDCHLKVMLEEDYFALKKHVNVPRNESDAIGSAIVREIVLPELEKEVNTGRNFAKVRQIFNSIILASWFKINLKQALLNQVYSDRSKVKGIDLQDKTIKQKIYQRYLQAYKKGVFNFIKEDMDPSQGVMIPRKYFSGGWDPGMSAHPTISQKRADFDAAMGGKNNDLKNVQALLSSRPPMDMLSQFHMGTKFYVYNQTLPNGEVIPVVDIDELYRSNLPPRIIADIPRRIHRGGVVAFALRKSIFKIAEKRNVDIVLTKEIGDVPPEWLNQRVTLRLKTNFIFFKSNSPGPKITRALEFGVRVGAYFYDEINDPNYDEPLVLLTFNFERRKQRNQLMLWPFGGGIDFDGEEGKKLYERAGLIMVPFKTSELQKDEPRAMRQIVTNDPNYPSTEFPWGRFSRVYTGGRANPIKEGAQELGRESGLLSPIEVQEWMKGWMKGWTTPQPIHLIPSATRGQIIIPSASTFHKLPVNGSSNNGVNGYDGINGHGGKSRAMMTSPEGGIDLSTQQMKWDITRVGKGFEIKADPAMIRRIEKYGIDRLTPVIFRITSVEDVWPLAGLKAPPVQALQ